ncbi:MAG: cadherin domain-containing protein, partial [Campylobacteraceae bacterium]|nr:cadherin domain-containing protein [Campylobacteraceae bacterium]
LIDYETKSVYNLKATARNAHDTSNEANIAINVINAPDQEPVLIPTTLSIDENSPNGTYIGNMGIYAHGHSTITSFVITGTNSDWFSIDNTGKITVTDLAKLDYESKKIFNLKVKAMSSYGESTLVDLTININNVPDLPPVIQSSSYRFYINENSPAETLVGQLNINSNDSPVTSVVLSGTGSENFKAYNNGTIVVAEEAKLDYESVNRYYLSAKAVNAFGESNTVNVYIYLNNVQDNPPIISSYYYNFDVDENSPAETLVWQLNINDDGSPVTSVVLSGDGNEHFKVYNNGTIVVAEGAKLDYESKNYYYLSIKAVNAFGESNTVSFYIYIKNLKDTLPVLQDTNFNTYRKTPANKTIGVITTILSECGITEYVSDDSSVFGVRTNGEVYTKTAVQEDNIYTIHVYAKSLCGDSNTIKLTIDTQSRIIVSINDSYIAESIALSSDNTKAFVGDYGSLKIFNVSDPAKPELISSIGTSYHAYSVALSSDETKAFVGDSSSLKIFNVSDPAKPELISQINIDYATAVALSSDNTKAFVGDYGSLKIFNVSDPTKPELIGSIGASDSVEVIVLSSDETKAFVGDSRSFKIIDIEDFTKE